MGSGRRDSLVIVLGRLLSAGVACTAAATRKTLTEPHHRRRGTTTMSTSRSTGWQPGSRGLRRLGAGAALSAALVAIGTSVQAQDLSKYPDWSGQWKRPPGVGIQWDQTKRPGRTQEPPLTPEY